MIWFSNWLIGRESGRSTCLLGLVHGIGEENDQVGIRVEVCVTG